MATRRSVHLSSLILVGLCGAACSNTTSVGPSPGSGGMQAAGGASGGADGGVLNTGGSTASGEGSAATGGTSADASAAAAGASGSASCAGIDAFIRLEGQLPGAETGVKLASGCSGSYATPASYTTIQNGGAGATDVQLRACSTDGETSAVLTFRFEATSNDKARFVRGDLNYHSGAFGTAPTVVQLTETQVPVADWSVAMPLTTEGVGREYAGAFAVAAVPSQGVGPVIGSFRVCHMENRSDAWQ